MSEKTFLSLAEVMARWGRSRTFVYDEVRAGRLAPASRGKWTLAEIKRYERVEYVNGRRATKKAA